MKTLNHGVLLSILLITMLVLTSTANAKEYIYILAGQSNMMGKGKISKLPATYRKTPHNVKFYYQGRPRPLAQYAHFGPEIGFAHTIARAYPHDTHIIVKHVATGSSIEQWLPGSRLYKGLIRQLIYATHHAHYGQQKIAGGHKPKGVKIDAIIWMQGEQDARNKAKASRYEGHLKRFVTGLRTELNSPRSLFIMGQVSPEDAAFSMTKLIQQAQGRLQHSLSRTILIPTEDLGKLYDHVHYNAHGQLELGKRFAQALIKQQQQ